MDLIDHTPPGPGAKIVPLHFPVAWEPGLAFVWTHPDSEPTDGRGGLHSAEHHHVRPRDQIGLECLVIAAATAHRQATLDQLDQYAFAWTHTVCTERPPVNPGGRLIGLVRLFRSP